MVVISYGDRCVVVAGDRVDAAACSPLETRIGLKRDGVQVHHVHEVEGPQERPIAHVVTARGSPFLGRAAALVFATTNSDAGSTMQVTSNQICTHHLTSGSQPMLIWGGMGREHEMLPPRGEHLH